MITTLRERLTLVLLGLLPFHALMVTVLTKVILGSGHAPWTPLTMWKEGVLGLILGLAIIEYIAGRRRSRSAPAVIQEVVRSIDVIDWLILGLIALSLIVTAMTHGDWKLYAFGFKYDFVPLVAFLILRRVDWSEWFKRKLLRVLIAVGGIVIVYEVVGMLLPPEFFRMLGYSDLHSLYLPGSPIAAFQQIEGIGLRRLQSTFSGPNQLGLWLLIPLSAYLAASLPKRKGMYTVIVGLLLAIGLTFSRAALLGAFAIIAVAFFQARPRREFYKRAGAALVLCVIAVGAMSWIAPQVILRAASSREHLERPLAALQTMIAAPLGSGLGTAGPASNRVSDACVYLPEGSDASWAKDRPELCVFVANTQVQPIDRACTCPQLPENWYLQIGIELGVIGIVLYVTLVLVMLRRFMQSGKWKVEKSGRLSTFNFPLSAFLPFLGISIAALVLHAWEDSAVAYTVWILCSIAERKTRQ